MAKGWQKAYVRWIGHVLIVNPYRSSEGINKAVTGHFYGIVSLSMLLVIIRNGNSTLCALINEVYSTSFSKPKLLFPSGISIRLARVFGCKNECDDLYLFF